MHSALVPWTLGYLAGVLLGDATSGTTSVGKWLSLLCLAGTVLLKWRGRPWHFALPLFAAALGFWAQAPRADAPNAASANPALREPSDAPAGPPGTSLWQLEGVVCSDVRSTATGLQLQLVPHSLRPLGNAAPSAEPFRSQMPPVLAAALWPVRVVGTPLEPIWPGDRLRLALSWRALVSSVFDDRPREAQHAAPGLTVFRDAVLVLADEKNAQKNSLFARQPESKLDGACAKPIWLLRAAAKARHALLSASADAWARLPTWIRGPDEPAQAAAAFVLALTLGDRGPLRHIDALRFARGQPALEAQIKDAGVVHVLSVSGLHMSAIGLVVWGLVSWILRSIQGAVAQTRFAPTWIAQRWAALVTGPIVIAYTVIAGAEPPAVRAAVVLGLFLLGQICGRRARLREGLAIAILWVGLPVGFDSSHQRLFSPSLLLSFAATLGIAYLRPLAALLPWRVQRALARDAQHINAADLSRRVLHRLLHIVVRMLDASVAALLCTLPLCAYYFAEIQGASLLGNIAITPLAELVTLPCGLLAALAAAIWPPLSVPFAALAMLSARLSLWLVQQIAAWGLTIHTASPCLLWVAAWFCGLVLLRWHPVWGRCLLLVLLLIHVVAQQWPSHALRLTFVSVGQGDAAIAELPEGGVLVIDTGHPGLHLPTDRADTDPVNSIASADSGQTALAPLLRRRGHRRIDLLIVSHRHPDHMGGAITLLRQFEVDVLWLPQASKTPRTDREAEPLAQAEADLVRVAHERGTLVAAAHSRVLSGVQLDVLSPCPTLRNCRARARSDWHENDNSLVVALRYAGRSVLMTGDIEAAAEATLCQQQPAAALRADVLKLPHHGSRTSSGEALLRIVDPKVAIASLGWHNRYGFPHSETVRRLHDLRIPLLRTDLSGSIQVEVNARGDLTLRRQIDAPAWSAWLPGGLLTQAGSASAAPTQSLYFVLAFDAARR